MDGPQPPTPVLPASREFARRYLQETLGWRSETPGPVLSGRFVRDGKATLHFLSGNGFCGGVYWPFLRALMPEFGWFAHDIEGQGESAAPADFSGVAAVSARIPAVISEQAALVKMPLVGIGHSFGAALTLRIAARQPALFRALVLMDPIVFPPAAWVGARMMGLTGLHPFARAARRRRAQWPSRAAAMDHLRGRGIYRGWTEEALASFAEHALNEGEGGATLRCPPALEAEIYEHPLYSWRDFARVRVPILFLHGAQSYPFLPGAARRAQRVNPGVEVQTPAGGHCFMQQDPAGAAAIVRTFLNKHL